MTRDSKSLITIDLFAGAGGLSLGLSQAGFDVRAALELDKNAAATFKRNHPDVMLFEQSIVGFSAHEMLERAGIKKKEVFLVAGGPPCQGFSMANGHSRNRENPDKDVRNQLVEEFIRFVDEIRPEVFIMENVLGFLSMQEKFVPPLIKRFEPLGYLNTRPFTLNAARYGVPQLRKRVFVIGSKRQLNLQFEPTYGSEKYLTVKEALFGDLPHIRKGTAGFEEPVDYNEITPSTDYQRYLRARSNKVYNHITTISNEKVTRRFSKIEQGSNGIALGKEIGIAIQYSSCYKRLKASEPAITMSNFRKSMIMPPTQDRILSVREAARLQSFPDTFIFEGGISSMQQQVGNAVPPLLAFAVGEQLITLFSP
jgi:DNA (cytosine-5)-methyltransferase 1